MHASNLRQSEFSRKSQVVLWSFSYHSKHPDMEKMRRRWDLQFYTILRTRRNLFVLIYELRNLFLHETDFELYFLEVFGYIAAINCLIWIPMSRVAIQQVCFPFSFQWDFLFCVYCQFEDFREINLAVIVVSTLPCFHSKCLENVSPPLRKLLLLFI